MKRFVFVLFTFFVLMSCSKSDDESYVIPSDGQYVGYVEYDKEHGDYSSTVCIVIENGLCKDFVLYRGMECFNYYRPANIRTNGRYPQYTYRINDFAVLARFSDLENFTANLFGVLYTHKETDYGVVGEVYEAIALEAANIHFKLDNTGMDADGDGFLDNKQ